MTKKTLAQRALENKRVCSETVLLDRNLSILSDHDFEKFEEILNKPLPQNSKLVDLINKPSPWE